MMRKAEERIFEVQERRKKNKKREVGREAEKVAGRCEDDINSDDSTFASHVHLRRPIVHYLLRHVMRMFAELNSVVYGGL